MDYSRQEALLKAVQCEADRRSRRDNGLRWAMISGTGAVALGASWYIGITEWDSYAWCISSSFRWLLWTESNGVAEWVIDASRVCVKFSSITTALVATLSLATGVSAAMEDSPTILEELNDEQRRLFGLESLTKKPFPASEHYDSTPQFQSATVTSTEPQPIPPDMRTRPGWGDMTPVGPFLLAREAYRADGRHIHTPISGSGMGRRRGSPGTASSAASGRTLAFGGSASRKVDDLLQDYTNELLTPNATPEPQAYTMASLFANSTPGTYKESPLPPPTSYLSKGGLSPSKRVDPAEWARTLRRLGLDRHQLQVYVDNVREVLYNAISEVLDKFYELVEIFEGLGIPRDLLLGKRGSSTSSQSLDEALMHVAQLGEGYRQYVRHFVAMKRMLREGYHWKDQLDYVLRRLEELTSDSYLSNYDWERGGPIRTSRNVSVDVDMPTDADIVMAVFLFRCDMSQEHRLTEGDQPFTKQHFVQMTHGEEQRSLRGRNLIVRHATHPPHFSMVEAGTMYRIPPGKSNVFQAIVIFLYLARREGWLSVTNETFRQLMHAVFGAPTHPVPLRARTPTPSG